jgi:Zn-dependent protease
MSEIQSSSDQLTPLVSKYFDIEKVIWGGSEHRFVVRYEGQLKGDSLEAHQVMSEALKSQKLTPQFLDEVEAQAIQIVPSAPKPKPSNPLVNLVLFLFTFVSVLISGTINSGGVSLEDSGGLLREVFSNLELGLSFALSLLAILLAHEFGHYLAGRYHRTAVTLPYFLPLPFTLLGTLGAFIQLKEPPRNRRELLDIGIAGPLAGLIVAIPILLFGLSLSEVGEIPLNLPEGNLFEGNSILYLAAKFITHGQLLPAPASFGGLSPLVYWLRYFFTGLPTPLGGTDVFLHPIAWAGWAGLLVTALNLIPAGQLDGGHLLYSLFGKSAGKILPIIFVVLAGLGFFWSGWWLWVFLIFMLGRSHAQPLDEITQLDGKRKLLALFGLLIFVLVFTPIPLS